jgi:4-carboxymuconolactone decarboxylase
MSDQDRMPPIPPERWSDAQRKYAEAIVGGPRGRLNGPFVPLLRSPELMDRAQRVGEYLRYGSAIGTRLSELAILVTSRQWTQQVEWAIHAPIALDVGIAPGVVDAIAHGRRPDAMSDDEAIVHDFCVELHTTRAVTDATYARALARFGEQGVVDLLGINGYYTFLAMIMNGTRTAAPDSAQAPLSPL